MSQQIGITYMISRTDSLIRLIGYDLLNEDLMNNSNVDNYYGEYQFYRIAGAMVGVIDRAINNSTNSQEIENYKTLALRYIAINRKLTEKIAANNDRYLTKHQTLAYIKEIFSGPLEALCIISDQDFFDAWHLVNTW